jgi:hypothetical protein
MAATYETSLTPAAVTFLAAGEAETVAFDAGSGADRVLLVGVCWRDRNNSISGVTYNGVAMTSMGAEVTENAVFSAQAWRLVNPASGSNNIVVTMGVGDNSSSGLIGAWVGNTVDQTTPVDALVTNSGSGNTANMVSSGTVTSATDDRVVVFHCLRNLADNDTSTPTNYTERQDANTGAGIMMTIGDAAGAASVATSATWTNAAAEQVEWVVLGINVNASGGAGGRASKNTHSHPLGVGLGLGLGIGGS